MRLGASRGRIVCVIHRNLRVRQGERDATAPRMRIQPDVTQDLTAASLIAEITLLMSRAAAEIMRIRAVPMTSRLKDDQSPVTPADEASEAIILDGLSRLLSGIPLISEEAVAKGGGGTATANDAFLLVDPLDGTREFIAGRDEFTINVAIVHAGRAMTGLLAAPARGKIWRGTIGRGAEALPLAAGADPRAATPRSVAVRPFATPPVALMSRSHPDPQTQAFLNTSPNAERRICGSALKFAMLAEGAADLYPRLSPTSEWDIAAGDAILTAAGGAVLGPDGQPLLYGRGDCGFRVPAFIAWGDPKAAARYRSGL